MPYIKEYTNLQPKEKRQLMYKRRYKQDRPEWDDSMIILKDLVDKHTKNQSTVLDVGCGHGNFVIDELRKKFSLAVGIDVSPEVMQKNICLDRCVVGEISSMPFESQAFDTVISLWVMEHIKNPETCFKEIQRVLKSGGIFAFVTPNKSSALIQCRRLMTDNLAKKLVEKIYNRTEADTFEVQYKANTAKDIKKLAEKSGFKILCLKENADPTYTSFGTISYSVSKFFSALPLSFVKPHLIVILKKP